MDSVRIPNQNLDLILKYIDDSPSDEFDIESALNEFNEIGIPQVSQLCQDVIAYSVIGKSGRFLEIGAGDGYHLSNTFNLERFFSWTGCLIEPLPRFQQAIKSLNRQFSDLIPFAISGKCGFEQLVDSGELSGFLENMMGDDWGEVRAKNHDKYGIGRVVGICPTQLLIRVGNKFDFITIDTEGSEISILNSWPFEIFSPKIIMVENSLSPSRVLEIDEILAKNGYEIVLRSVSMWDSWYIRSEIIQAELPDFCPCNISK